MSNWSEAAKYIAQRFVLLRVIAIVIGSVILGTFISNLVVPPPYDDLQRSVKSIEHRIDQQNKRLDTVEQRVTRLDRQTPQIQPTQR